MSVDREIGESGNFGGFVDASDRANPTRFSALGQIAWQ